mgnify:CR=1 FL=1
MDKITRSKVFLMFNLQINMRHIGGANDHEHLILYSSMIGQQDS